MFLGHRVGVIRYIGMKLPTWYLAGGIGNLGLELSMDSATRGHVYDDAALTITTSESKWLVHSHTDSKGRSFVCMA